jgi:hypothetical protein
MQKDSHSHPPPHQLQNREPRNLSRRRGVRFTLFPGDPFSYSALLTSTSTLEYGVWSVWSLTVKRFKTGVETRISTGYLLIGRLLSTTTRASF